MATAPPCVHALLGSVSLPLTPPRSSLAVELLGGCAAFSPRRLLLLILLQTSGEPVPCAWGCGSGCSCSPGGSVWPRSEALGKDRSLGVGCWGEVTAAPAFRVWNLSSVVSLLCVKSRIVCQRKVYVRLPGETAGSPAPGVSQGLENPQDEFLIRPNSSSGAGGAVPCDLCPARGTRAETVGGLWRPTCDRKLRCL